jgi:protein ImuA
MYSIGAGHGEACGSGDIHPSLWRGAQLARAQGRVVETGYPVLARELPGGGWPTGALIDLIVTQSGVGELRLLVPALAALAPRPVVLLQPPQTPNDLGLSHIGLALERIMLLRGPKSADVFWSAEQILRAGTCGALIFWTQYVQASSLRRLHLAAQSSESLFVMVRPIATAQDASPAVLRLALRPSSDGLTVDVVKRRACCTQDSCYAARRSTVITGNVGAGGKTLQQPSP